jgi:hypothetical protein
LEGKALADKFNMPFIEVSAKTGVNINQAFNLMGEQLVDNYLANRKV